MSGESSTAQYTSDILVVEDSPVQAVVLLRRLMERGYVTDLARSGSEGLEKLEQMDPLPSLIISDVEMPDMNGFEMCRQIKENERTRHIPVIIVTALAEPEDVIRGLESGADGYVTKPYDAKYLLVRVESLIANKERFQNREPAPALEITYAGQKRTITADRLQILNLLFSTYENIVKQNHQLMEMQLELRRNNTKLQEAYQESERLLLNILPKKVASELKARGSAEPVSFESVTVLFTDFKGFTKIAETMTPKELVQELDDCFSYFDNLMDRYRMEKLKTIGDSYMCAGGIPESNATHAVDACLAALEIQRFMTSLREERTRRGKPFWQLRLGIHTGPLVAGVIGDKKFAYDVWGDTVNTASRMESSGTPERVNVSQWTHEVVKNYFDCEHRGKVHAKNKGEIHMYYVNRLKPEYSEDDLGFRPNDALQDALGRMGAE